MKGFKVAFLLGSVFLGLCSGALLEARSSYRSVLKDWTRHDEAYSWNNLETRLRWHATYLGAEYRAARRQRMQDLYDWAEGELRREEATDRDELRRYDDFFVAIYAGSSDWPEVGKDPSEWKILLEVAGRDPVKALSFEEVTVTQLERTLYPYVDKWSKVFRARFPKTVDGKAGFRLKFPGIPARSELVWN